VAKFFGHRSKYSQWRVKKIYIGLAFICIVVLIAALTLSQLNGDAIIIGSAICVILGIFVTSAGEISRMFSNFIQGDTGEWQIKKELLRLPSNYTVFQDVDLGRGNIDFVVVGPSGVFAVEVKSHRGKIVFDGSRLLKYGQPFRSDFLNQAWGEKMSLQSHLSKTGTSIEVVPILVFTRAWLDFGFQPVRGVYVLRKNMILRFIQFINKSKDIPLNSVEAALQKVV
jgi:hypothetical protein